MAKKMDESIERTTKNYTPDRVYQKIEEEIKKSKNLTKIIGLLEVKIIEEELSLSSEMEQALFEHIFVVENRSLHERAKEIQKYGENFKDTFHNILNLLDST